MKEYGPGPNNGIGKTRNNGVLAPHFADCLPRIAECEKLNRC